MSDRDPASRLRTLCLQCGPNVPIDEEERCATCGATATGPWLDRVAVLAGEEPVEAEMDEVTIDNGEESWTLPAPAPPEAAHDAHVIEKIRHGGERHSERVFYAVGPVRGSLAEAHDDEAKMVETTVSRREEELEGQVAALRGAMGTINETAHERGGEDALTCRSCHAILGISDDALANAGREEAEVLRAVVAEHEAEAELADESLQASLRHATRKAVHALRDARGGKEEG